MEIVPSKTLEILESLENNDSALATAALTLYKARKEDAK